MEAEGVFTIIVIYAIISLIFLSGYYCGKEDAKDKLKDQYSKEILKELLKELKEQKK